jgi:hypothetical protein
LIVLSKYIYKSEILWACSKKCEFLLRDSN